MAGPAGWDSPRRRGSQTVTGADDDGWQPFARTRRTGGAEPMAKDRGRYPHQERAGPRIVRRYPAAWPLRPGDVCLDQLAGERAALDPAFERDPERGERLCRPERDRFRQRRDGPADRRAGNRARPRQAKDAVGRGTAPLRRRPAVTAALLPLRRVHPAEMAVRGAPDRQPVADDAMDHRLVRAAVTR